MSRVAGVIRMQLKDWIWIALPWIVLLSAFFVNLILFATIDTEEENYTGALASIFIILFTNGIMTINQQFSFALGFSVRRKDYFWGTTAVVLILSALYAAALTVLTLVERASGGWGARLHFFRVHSLSDGSAAEWGWIMFVAFLNMFFAGFVFSCWKRRFGLKALFALLVVLALVLIVVSVLGTYYEGWDNLYRLLKPLSVGKLFTWLIIPPAINAFISYLLLRRTTA
ncbi:hypothetical protein COLU111180_05380 [Cohnella lubricantis]|uniref:Uncharacterized protein n=1 Tax=Cohnella lubricantis TaxID=2163172 RepID=A0A841TFR7_9BACL|nr:hypothetical protein [Cohnella lubricantis]MBB6677311.1 hypothetical protein [Cohnella lubricantis]MBP2116877.1 hypothetical protein [Cohnella lubricantis]